MASVRVLVGTRKGAFVLTSDGARRKWSVAGPHFAGWEIYHMKGSPADPNRLFVSQSSGWFGQVIQRSDDGGKTWSPPGSKPEDLVTPQGWPKGESNKFVYDTSARTGRPLTTHQWYDGTQHPWEFKRVWHIEPSLGDLPPQRLPRPTRHHFRLPVQRLVRADHPALQRRGQDLGATRHARRRADDDAGGHAKGREQQVRLRHCRHASHHAPVVRRHPTPLGVQTRLAR